MAVSKKETKKVVKTTKAKAPAKKVASAKKIDKTIASEPVGKKLSVNAVAEKGKRTVVKKTTKAVKEKEVKAPVGSKVMLNDMINKTEKAKTVKKAQPVKAKEKEVVAPVGKKLQVAQMLENKVNNVSPVVQTPQIESINSEVKASAGAKMKMGGALNKKVLSNIKARTTSSTIKNDIIRKNCWDKFENPQQERKKRLNQSDRYQPRVIIRDEPTERISRPQLTQEKLVDVKKQPQKKKLVVITGATSGMGLEVTKKLVAQGDCCIIAIGRRPQACRDLMMSMRKQYPNTDLHFLVSDLSMMSQVRELIGAIQVKLLLLGYECIDVLYLNAGTMTGEVRITDEGNEVQWATNYLSACLLTEKLYPLLRKSKNGKIIFMTDDRANKSTLDWAEIKSPNKVKPARLYDQSKLADLMYALEFERRHRDEENINTYVVDPGKVRTGLSTKDTSGLKKTVNSIRNQFATPVEQSIGTVMYLINTPELPNNLVFYKDERPQMPSNYAMNIAKRKELYDATLRMLGLEPDDLYEE